MDTLKSAAAAIEDRDLLDEEEANDDEEPEEAVQEEEAKEVEEDADQEEENADDIEMELPDDDKEESRRFGGAQDRTSGRYAEQGLFLVISITMRMGSMLIRMIRSVTPSRKGVCPNTFLSKLFLTQHSPLERPNIPKSFFFIPAS